MFLDSSHTVLKNAFQTVHSFFTRIIRVLLAHRIYLTAFFATVCFLFGTWVWFGVYQPPSFFPLRTIVSIPEGATLSEAAHILKTEQVIQSELAFKVLIEQQNGQVVAGDYFFDTRLTLTAVAMRLRTGEYGLEPTKVTIPEGATTYQMADILKSKLERFDPVAFSLLAEEKEGYLFPDTYFFLPNATAEEIVHIMELTFYERLRSIEEKIALFGKPVHEIVTMASLLEKEAWRYEDRRMIAGVLWKRIEIGMPLQVDAVFGFIERTDTFSPKFSHLEVDSAYNTYRYTGLPPSPIGSPSFEALEAAVSPVETEALFYLHGKDGSLHMANTYTEHLKNRRLYLD